MNEKLFVIAAALTLVAVTAADAAKCPPNSVPVGPLCVDTYEASVWETTDPKTIKKIRTGRIKDAGDLTEAVQRGADSEDYGAGCPRSGDGCVEFFALSIPGVVPSRFTTWFRAAAACRNAGKRLLTNGEWQAAALGTADPGSDDGVTDCNIASVTLNLPEDPVNTGSRSACVSDIGVFDMVGNVNEWVADWAEQSSGCSTFVFGDDRTCFAGDGSINSPSALLRGGDSNDGVAAGVYSLGTAGPAAAGVDYGFRCAR